MNTPTPVNSSRRYIARPSGRASYFNGAGIKFPNKAAVNSFRPLASGGLPNRLDRPTLLRSLRVGFARYSLPRRGWLHLYLSYFMLWCLE